MKVALVSQSYPPFGSGGIASQTLAKARGLSTLGHQITVITSGNGDSRVKKEVDGIELIQLPATSGGFANPTEIVRWQSNSLAVARELELLNDQAQLDLVEFPEYGAESYAFLLNRQPWSTIPTVIQLHGPLTMLAHTIGWPEFESELYRVGTFMEATCLRLSDAVYSSSQLSIDWCRAEYGLSQPHVPVMHTGVDCARFHPNAAAKTARPTIIFVGRMASSKGIDDLVDAAFVLAAKIPKLALRLIGPDPDDRISGLRQRADVSGYPDLIDYLGPLPREQLAEHLASSHVFAAPSQYEGGPGMVYLEAMACGLPAIACSGSGASEVVHAGATGLLGEPGDIVDLTNKLEILLENPERSRSMGRAARKYVEQHADERDCILKIEQFYRSVIESVAVDAPFLVSAHGGN